jgi:serine/threonine-protein kinase
MESALRILEGPAAPVLGPAPALVAAMARHRLGQTDQARLALASAIASYNWDPQRPATREAWIYHVLRREAEQTLQPLPPATEQPQ